MYGDFCVGITPKLTSTTVVGLHQIRAHSKGKGSQYSITERRVPVLIPILVSQPAGDVNKKPDGRLLLLSARPAVTPATLKRAATSFYRAMLCIRGTSHRPVSVSVSVSQVGVLLKRLNVGSHKQRRTIAQGL